jgi:geranyl-CoA carboxylase alpha subunit
VRFEGHAIEARLYAEDPTNDYAPQTGTLVRWRVPEGVRVDSGVIEGDAITPHYDPMIAKIIAHGATRDDARRKLARALSDATVFGVVTNKSMLAEICLHPSFADGSATTAFLKEHAITPAPASAIDFATAAMVVYCETARPLVQDEGDIGWRSGGPIWSAIRFSDAELRVTREGPRRFRVALDAESVELQLGRIEEGALTLVSGGVERRVRHAIDGTRVWIDDGKNVRVYENTTHEPAKREEDASGRITAPHDGAVAKVFARLGDRVERGQSLLVIEAMKMEQQIKAGLTGTVSAIHAKAGDQVRTGQLLVELEEK